MTITSNEKLNPARRRFVWRLASCLALWGLAQVLVNSTFNGWGPDFSGATGVFWSVLPALPIGAAIWWFGVYLAEEPDEFARMKQVRGMLIGIGLTLFACTVWGELHRHMGVAPWPLTNLFPMWCFFSTLGAAYVAWRYR